ncbi:PH domain-containing protein [Dermatophilaceae bacterium Soc4.6]
MTEPAPRPDGTPDPFRPFRSRRGRAVATTLGVLSLVIFGAIAALLPGRTPTDAVLIAAFGVVIAVMCWRYATISALVTREGIVVRNLMTTRRLTWAQVLRVQFGDGAPWVTLDLDDTDQLAVMAIQRADGPGAAAEASRLAALVQALGEARR